MIQSLESWHCVTLYNFIKKHGIKTVLETGISHGMSSYFFLGALSQTHGRLISIEPVIQEHIIPNKLDPRWTIIHAKSTDIMAKVLNTFGPVDLFFHDSLHEYDTMMFEFQTAIKYAKYIGSHDINHKASNGAWYEFAKDHLDIIHSETKFAIGRVK